MSLCVLVFDFTRQDVAYLLNLDFFFFSQHASVTLRVPSAPCATPAEVSVGVDPTSWGGTVTTVLQLRSSSAPPAADVSKGRNPTS